MIVTRNCDNCKNKYQADTRELNRGNGIYCSRKCSGEAKSKKSLANPLPNNAECAYCHVGIRVTNQRRKNSTSGLFFCSREHQALALSDPTIPIKPGPVKSSTTSLCIEEGCTTKTKNERCRPCRMKYEMQLWLDGDMTMSWIKTTHEPRNFVKQYLLDTRGDKCEWCGYCKPRPDGTSKIQMDHIDGDYTNNDLDNLRLLCPNCHEDTPTFGSKNRNGGRRYRLAVALGK